MPETEEQTLLFYRDAITEDGIRAWAAGHGLTVIKIEDDELMGPAKLCLTFNGPKGFAWSVMTGEIQNA